MTYINHNDKISVDIYIKDWEIFVNSNNKQLNKVVRNIVTIKSHRRRLVNFSNLSLNKGMFKERAMDDIKLEVRVLDESVDADIKRLQGLKESLKVYYDQALLSYSSGYVSYTTAITRFEGSGLEGERYDKYLTSAGNWVTDANTRKTELSEGITQLQTIMSEIETKISELKPKRYYYEWRVM